MLIFCFAPNLHSECIKTKEEENDNFYANTLLLDQKVFKKSRLTLSLRELPTTKIHFGFGNNANSTFHSTNESRPQALWILSRFIEIEF